MSKFYKIFGIIAGALLVAGGILVAIGFGTGAARQTKLFNWIDINYGDTDTLNTQELMELDEFSSIYADVSMGDVTVIASDKYAVEYALYSKNVSCKVVNGVLKFSETGSKINGINLDLGFLNRHHKDSYVKIYVPKETLDNVTIDNDMGDITINGIKTKSFDVTANMGDIKLTDMESEKTDISADMGDITYEGKVTDYIKATDSMGNITITGDLLCDITASCDMGDAEVATCYEPGGYQYDIDTDMGDKNINLNGGKKAEGQYKISVTSDMGDVTLTFQD